MRTSTSLLVLVLLGSVAAADPNVRVQPTSVRPGDAVLVTVTGVDDTPRGTLAGRELTFFRSRGGFQAVAAVPLDSEDDAVKVVIPSAKRTISIVVKEHEFPHSDVAVEEELANPDAPERARIDDDNKKMLAALTDDTAAPEFTQRFVRPKGRVTSPFGEWRRFNDGHTSQHLGLDVIARAGTPVHAVNRGTVAFVGETLLGGNVVIVRHGAGIASAYMHLSQIDVALGDVVERGATLGKSGETGRTTGPHLHVAIRVPGGFVDPARFFALRMAPIAASDTVVGRK